MYTAFNEPNISDTTVWKCIPRHNNTVYLYSNPSIMQVCILLIAKFSHATTHGVPWNILIKKAALYIDSWSRSGFSELDSCTSSLFSWLVKLSFFISLAYSLASSLQFIFCKINNHTCVWYTCIQMYWGTTSIKYVTNKPIS